MRNYSKKCLDNKNFKPKIALWTGQQVYSLMGSCLSLVNEKYLILNLYLINNFFYFLKFLST